MKKITFITIITLLLFCQKLKAESLPVLINQIMVGQNESVKNEFVELYNPNDFNISLEGYSLKKKTLSGNESSLVSSKNFVGTIAAKAFFLISSKKYGPQIHSDLNYSSSASMAKNNTIILYNKEEKVSDMIDVRELKNDQSLKRDGTINKEEIILKNSKNETITIINKKTEENIEEKESVSGIVINLPGNLASQYFYIVEKNHLNGYQIYSYYKEFPEIEIGDEIIVFGELTTNKDGYRIKTKKESDIQIKSKNNQLPETEEVTIKELEDIPLGSLVEIKGMITQNKTNAIYIDDGEEEIEVKIKKSSGINSKILIEGEEYTIKGILTEDSITPTDQSFIIPSKEREEVVVGMESKEKNITIENTKKENIMVKYFFSIIILIIVIYLVKDRFKNLLF